MKISLWTRVLILVAIVWAAMFAYQMLPEERKLGPGRLASEYFGRVLSKPYFHIGDLAVTPAFLLKGILFLILLTIFSAAFRRFLRTRVLIHTSMDEGQRYAFARMAGYLTFFIGLIVGLQSAGVNLNSLVVFGGAVGIGIGFGLQTIANNFISGLVLLAERPIKLGDRVEVGTVNGDVVRIAGRSTWVRTNDNVVIIVPNSEFISSRVTNWTANDRQVRFAVPLGVSYGSDPEEVRAVLLEVARQNADVLSEPSSEVLFCGFGDSALNFELRVWTITKVQRPQALISELYFAIFRAFRERGIQIPFPQRDLHLKSASVVLPISQKA